MSLVQTVDLEQIVDNTSPAIISRWVAAHNPVYLEWIRKDTLVTDTDTYGVGFALSFKVADNSAYSPGDLIYANTTAVTGVFEVDILVSTNEIVTTSLGYAFPFGTYPGYINNLTTRKNYYTEIELTNSNGATQLALLQATPDTTGKVGIDISGALQSYLSNDDDAPLTSWTYYEDINAYIPFKYRIKENWTGSAESYGSLSDLHFGVNGAFQNLHEYNGNYVEYYTNNSVSTSKYLYDFDEKINLFDGFPFDISFLWTNDLNTTSSNQLTVTVIAFDQNDNNLGISVFYLPNTLALSFVRFDPYVNIDPNQKYLKVFIQDDSLNQIIEPVTINLIDTTEICTGVYLEWLGEKGNRSYFLFNDKYQESLQVDGGGTYQKAFDGIDDLTERANWYEKKPFKKLTVGAEGLERYEIEGLKTLLKSTRVYEVQKDGTKQGVLLEPGTFQIGRGDDNKFRIEFTIVYPEQFNQTA